MTENAHPTEQGASETTKISVGGDVGGSIVAGNNNTTSIQKIINTFKGDNEAIEQRNRKAMLELVKNIWVKGVLEKSLYNEVLIQLGMENKPGAVQRPWDMLLQTSSEPDRPMPPGTTILQVFDELNGAMLILGEPGAGKTTTLLQLARDTINRAELENSQPIPVIFNLSSWIDPAQPLTDWLIAELGNKYFVSKKVAQDWVEKDQLLLLLDGLDEVKQEHREPAIQAVNDFRKAHGLTKLAVCCRIADYEAIKIRLQLWGAVLLQPLTARQIDEYFAHAGMELSSVRQALQLDITLQEMAYQPLMLSILTLAYRCLPIEALIDKQDISLESRRKHIFNTYIQQMFGRSARTANSLYTAKQTTHWLAWLAQNMVEQRQSIFLLERINRDWLQNNSLQLLHRVILTMGVGLPLGVFFPIVAISLGGLAGGLTGRWLDGMIKGLFFGIFCGGPLLSVFSGIILSRVQYEKPVELLSWSWKNAWHGPEGWLDGWVSGGLYNGLLFGLLNGLIGGLLFGPSGGLLWGLLGGLAGGLAGGIAGGLITKEIVARIIPNHGIHLSIKNAILGARYYALIGLLMFAPIIGLLIMLLTKLSIIRIDMVSAGLLGVVYGVLLGMLAGGIVGGLRNGGVSVISHYTLRYLLYRQNYMPKDYIRFLDYCAERIFLRKVGGGYIFIHRLLMEHFAAMDPENE